MHNTFCKVHLLVVDVDAGVVEEEEEVVEVAVGDQEAKAHPTLMMMAEAIRGPS